MAFFQNSVINKYIQNLDKQTLQTAYAKFRAHFHNAAIQENIRGSKEEQYQGEFLIDLFVNVLGYTKNPTPNFNLTTEYKNVKDSKKADGAIIINDIVKAVIELKGTNTTDLNKIEVQAFGYKNNQPDCEYVITSNFEKIRFYIDNAIEYVEFNLFTLTEKEFELLYICLSYDSIAKGLPKQIKDESVSQEDLITKKLYKDYSFFKNELYHSLVKLNPQYEPLELFKKSQKLLDRFLFIFFAEDRQLLPTNLIFRINKEWQQLREMRIEVSLYDRYKIYFNDLDQGATVSLPAFSQTASKQKEEFQIYAYNGGLFKNDDLLNDIKIEDELLFSHTEKLSNYDFASEVDVNVLGHIFENSLNDVDEIKAQLEGQEIDKTKTKRKKDGVFYTPKYITKYIVDNTVGKLCLEKKEALLITESDFTIDKKRQKKTTQALTDKLNEYRNWLLQLTICDPACGSGAFLNQALDFLITEHRYIDELQAKLFGDALVLSDVEGSILENNLFGVDINEESVEIAKLSLWLRTAQPNRKLNDLNSNIKCGNSLIDDVAVAGDKAFNWNNSFKEVFEKGGFDVVIGNPPYGALLSEEEKKIVLKNYSCYKANFDIYSAFIQLAFNILKEECIWSFINPVSWQSGENYFGLREYLSKNGTLKIAIKLPYNVFEDAYVDTGIYVVTKKVSENYLTSVYDFPIKAKYTGDLITDINYELLPNKYWQNIPSLRIVLSPTFYELLSKINSNVIPLNSISNSIRGILPNESDVSAEIKSTDKKYFVGSVNRYINTNDFFGVNYGDHLKEKPKDYSFFQGERILIRRIISRQFRVMATYADDEFVNKKDYYILKVNNLEYDAKFILAIICSKLISFLKTKGSTNASKDDFAQLSLSDVREIPIKPINIKDQKILAEKANLMLALNKEFQEYINKFLNYFTMNYKIQKPNTKLLSWYDLAFEDFIKEINNAIKLNKNTPLSKKDEFDWIDLFNENKKKALELKAKIDATDKEIDQMVYKLYDLTEEEIKIVEG